MTGYNICGQLKWSRRSFLNKIILGKSNIKLIKKASLLTTQGHHIKLKMFVSYVEKLKVQSYNSYLCPTFTM